MNKKSYRIIIIEPSKIVVSGIKDIVKDIDSFSIVGELSDINRVEEKLSEMRADIVIINPQIVPFHNRDSIKSYFPNIPIVALMYGYVDSNVLRQFQGIIDICDTQSKIASTLQVAIKEYVVDNVIAESGELSDREKEILVAVAKGMINKEIASLFNISIHTVISHRKNISRKTGIKSASGFVVYALLNNLLEQSDIHY